MSREDRRPLRVEHAFELLPAVEELGPLLECLLASSRPEVEVGRDRTVGKRRIESSDVRERVPQALARAQTHLASLYEAAVAVLEARQRDDPVGIVRALLTAGEVEERAGRGERAREWYERALGFAEGLQDRRPEVVVLRRLGDLLSGIEGPEAAARCYQRSLAIAEASLDRDGAAAACLGLGNVALGQDRWQGADSWFRRGLQCGAEDLRTVAHLHLGRSGADLGRARHPEAVEELARAHELAERVGDGPDIVRVLLAGARVDLLEGRRGEALARLREALARLRDIGGGPALEVAIRLEIGRLYSEWGRLPDAEDELRRAEETTILLDGGRDLARVYLELGRLRSRQGDESGFLFFEKAIELVRGSGPAPRLEADAYYEYGKFRRGLGELEEARAYLDHARDIAVGIAGNGRFLARIEEEIARLPAEDADPERER